MPEFESTWEDYAPDYHDAGRDFSTWDDHAPSFVAIGRVHSAYRDIAPAYQWTIDTLEPLRRVYIATLHASGFDDLEIPISSLQYRLRDDGWSYIVCVIPDAETWEDLVEAYLDADGEIRIASGWANLDDERQLQEMARADLHKFSTDIGVQSSSLTLTAYREITTTNPRTVTLTNITVLSLQADGNRRVRCEPNVFLRPGDTATFGSDSITVSSIAMLLDKNNQRMDVTGL